MLEAFLCILWIFVSLFLVLIILLQRGKGGGLAGALGGVGGSSAFGTKAGDIFTRITVGVFAVWLLLAMILVWKMKPEARFIGAAGPVAKEAKGTAKDEPKLPIDDNGKGPEGKGKIPEDKTGASANTPKTGDVGKSPANVPQVAPELTKDKDGKSAAELKKEDSKSGEPKNDSSTPAGRSDKSPDDKSKTPPDKNAKDTGKKS